MPFSLSKGEPNLIGAWYSYPPLDAFSKSSPLKNITRCKIVYEQFVNFYFISFSLYKQRSG